VSLRWHRSEVERQLMGHEARAWTLAPPVDDLVQEGAHELL
jgi:hypothetical protein